MDLGGLEKLENGPFLDNKRNILPRLDAENPLSIGRKDIFKSLEDEDPRIYPEHARLSIHPTLNGPVVNITAMVPMRSAISINGQPLNANLPTYHVRHLDLVRFGPFYYVFIQNSANYAFIPIDQIALHPTMILRICLERFYEFVDLCNKPISSRESIIKLNNEVTSLFGYLGRMANELEGSNFTIRGKTDESKRQLVMKTEEQLMDIIDLVQDFGDFLEQYKLKEEEIILAVYKKWREAKGPLGNWEALWEKNI